MIKLTALTLIIAAAADHGTWDHPQQAELPSHEWLVVDHAPGTSFGLGVCVAGNSVLASAQITSHPHGWIVPPTPSTRLRTQVFTAGSMAYGITLTNAATGASVEGSNEGEDRDIFLAKIALDGTPAAVFTYPGDTGPATSYPRDL